MRRFDATPRRATPKGHKTFISCPATHQESRIPTNDPSPRSWRTIADYFVSDAAGPESSLPIQAARFFALGTYEVGRGLAAVALVPDEGAGAVPWEWRGWRGKTRAAAHAAMPRGRASRCSPAIG